METTIFKVCSIFYLLIFSFFFFFGHMEDFTNSVFGIAYFNEGK